MNYWHIQMNQPWGRDEGKIDSSQLLKEEKPVIGTGIWEDRQCEYFTGEDYRGIKIGDIVLVREGKKPIALCKIIGDCFTNEELKNKYIHHYYRYVEILDFYSGNDVFPQSQGTLERLINNTDSLEFIKNYYREILEKKDMEELIDLLNYKKQIILQGPPGTGKTRKAKEIAVEILGLENVEALENHPQFRIVQFHPSYSYEDFVRGITAKSNEGGIVYKTENKVLGEMAEEALSSTFERKFYQYIDYLKNSTEEITFKNGEAKYIDIVDDKIFVKATRDKRYEYKYGIEDMLKYSYREYQRFLSYEKDMINGFKDAISYDFFRRELKDFEENFVLIIDEINRANLSVVLGELIYALEYRGESVESIYDIEGNRSFVLPPNLYIIGTMNTADRSVGHIDYAIRRRFAFVDLLPNKQVIENEKAQRLFDEVEHIFTDFLSPEFSKDEVMLGHSYFLEKEDKYLKIKLEFEIKPILKEYTKDGVLAEAAIEKINALDV